MLCEDERCLESSPLRPNTFLDILAQNAINALDIRLWPWFVVMKTGCNGAASTDVPGEKNLSNMRHDEHTDTPKKHVGGDSAKRPSFTMVATHNLSCGTGVKEENDQRESIGSPTETALPEKSLKEEVVVEVVNPMLVEDARLDPDGQAIECSSSFCGTQDELTDVEGRASEVELYHRDGNDANVSMDGSTQHLRRRKKALNIEWKTCRQGIEWRCRWLELRVRELQTKLNKYDEILICAKHEKEQLIDPPPEDSTSRSSHVNHKKRARVLRRQHRKKEEERADLKQCMSKHPLFSRYGKVDMSIIICLRNWLTIFPSLSLSEKKKRHSSKGLSAAEHTCDEASQGMLEFDDFNDDDEFLNELSSEEDSFEQLLWHIEALQMHVSKLKSNLYRGPLMHRSTLMKAHSGDAPLHSAQSMGQTSLFEPSSVMWGTSQLLRPSWSGAWPTTNGSKVKAGSYIARKRSIDFDTDSVIMPDHVMANYVEPARHAFINTPPWRLLNDVASPDGESSSNEDTDDELYKRHYTLMQAKEREHPDSPVSRIGSLPSEKGRSKIRGKGPSEAHVEKLHVSRDEVLVENNSNHTVCLVSIPKRKRWKRRSRDIASYAKNIDLLLYDSCMQPLEECKQDRPKLTMEDGKSKSKVEPDME